MRRSIPLHWRLSSQRYRLVGTGCTACGQVAFPPRERCPVCAENPPKPSIERVVTTTEEGFVAELPRLSLENHAVW